MSESTAIGIISWHNVADLSIRIARSGVASGTPILLLSPWPESIWGFRNIIPMLQGLGPVVAVDLPGFGRSEGRHEFMSPDSMGSFLHTLITSLGLSRVHAVGPDIGTLALLFAASRWPDMFESLVLGSGATSLPLAGKGLLELIDSPQGAFSQTEGGDLALGFIAKSAAREIPASVLDDYRASSEGSRFEHATNFVRAYKTDLPRLEPLLRSVATPTLILSSDQDVMVPPDNGHFLADRMPRSRHVILSAGHLVWEDASDAYAQAVAQWISTGFQDVSRVPSLSA
jgi:pimeloyl-ACP methyl ester carboxylesterase